MAQKRLKHVFTATGNSDNLHFQGYFSLSLSGFGAGTVKVQRKVNGQWKDVDSYTANAEDEGFDGAGHEYRFNCSAYTSGSLLCILEQ
jgi:hypothetical protein